MTDEEVLDVARTALEITALFYYHLYRNLGSREIEKMKAAMQSGKNGRLSTNGIEEEPELEQP